jgi:hypothetical protein
MTSCQRTGYRDRFPGPSQIRSVIAVPDQPRESARSRTPARSSADPVDLGARSDLIGAPEPMSIEAVLADQIAAGRALLMIFSVT